MRLWIPISLDPGARPGPGTTRMTSFWKVVHHSFDCFLHRASTEVQEQTDATVSDCIAFTSTISWPPTIKSTR